MQTFMITNIVPYTGTLKIVKTKHKTRPMIDCWAPPVLPTIETTPVQPIMMTWQPVMLQVVRK